MPVDIHYLGSCTALGWVQGGLGVQAGVSLWLWVGACTGMCNAFISLLVYVCMRLGSNVCVCVPV